MSLHMKKAQLQARVEAISEAQRALIAKEGETPETERVYKKLARRKIALLLAIADLSLSDPAYADSVGALNQISGDLETEAKRMEDVTQTFAQANKVLGLAKELLDLFDA